MKLSIKQKLTLMVVLAGLGFAVLLARQAYVIYAIRAIDDALITNEQVNSGMLTLRRHEKDFLARNDIQYVDRFEVEQKRLMEKVKTLKEYARTREIETVALDELEKNLLAYGNEFHRLVKVQEEIGLNEKQGLRGQLRNAVHEAEAVMKELGQDTLSKDMLMLRRREKDFMLRSELSYVEKFNKDLQIFYRDLDNSSVPQQQKQDIREKMETYRKGFHAMVNGYQTKGLDHEHGILGDMRDTVHKTETALQQLQSEIQTGLTAKSQSLIIVGFFIFAGLFLSVLIGAIYVSRSILNPVKNLRMIMAEASTNRDLTLRADLEGKDELTEMAATFNSMLEQFQTMVSNVVEAVHQVSVASTQLSTVTQQTADGVMEQHRESDMVATSMNEMTATVQEVAKNASQASNASTHADDAALKGRQIVDGVKQSIDALSREIEATAGSIGHLQVQTENIGTVLGVIREIADQTNLLALNAAIEAARAGEQGRGFAVVADEVRTLANRTQESTTEIQAIIENLQDAARTAVKTMQSGTEMTQQNVAQASEADRALDEITSAVKAITDMNNMIASAAEEQSLVAEEINRSVSSIAAISDETAQGASHVTDTANNLADLASHLQELANQFKVGSAHVDLTAAKSAHLAWKTHIRSFLDGKASLSLEQAVSHRDCVLGKWYYSEGMAKYGKLHAMQELEDPHAELHATIREIIKLKESGETIKAESLIGRIDHLSDTIVAYLDEIEKKALAS